MRAAVLTHLAMAALVGATACGAPEEPQGPPPPFVGGKADTWEEKTAFAKLVQPGDVFLTSSEEGTGCWYLSSWENWATDPRFCHAGLVVAKHGETGIDTIEALNEGQGIKLMTDEATYMGGAKKLAVLRVVDDDGNELGAERIKQVIDKALGWEEAPYKEPPISMHGDPLETGLYCSMLPWRAYLDGAGIDLDAFSIWRSIIVPFIVTPDEIYESPNVRVIYEHAPDLKAEDEIPEEEQPPAAEEPPPVPEEEQPAPEGDGTPAP